ncbi:MAG: gliding motility protein GldN [Bacteroidia bacterium]
MKHQKLLVAFLAIPFLSSAQDEVTTEFDPETGVLYETRTLFFEGEGEAESDETYFTYQKLTSSQRKPVRLVPIREADVMFATRIERLMDVKEKQNALCQWVRNPLAEVIFNAAENGEIMAYRNDSFNSTYRADTVLDMFGTIEYIKVPDRDFPGEFKDSAIYTAYNLEDVVKWRIIEDWIFDKQRGEMVVRIVGIAPIMNLEAEGVKLGEYEGFYIKWSEARKLLVNEPAFNRHNDGGSFTYYDFFERRQFFSYITKEPNVQDLSFADYDELKDNPLAQLLESERVKNELMNKESDMWQY